MKEQDQRDANESLLMSHGAHSKPPGQSKQQKVTLLALLLVALAAVFLLPQFVSEPWFTGGSEQGAVREKPSPLAVSPSTAAELTRYRQESQSVLAQIIASRDRLVSQQVSIWADIEFRQALVKIAEGDGQYSYGDYAAALSSYQQALRELTGLEQTGREKLAGALAEGRDAVESLNLDAAAAASELAMAIAPEEQKARTLAARTETLPQLAAQMEAGDRARAAGQLTAAEIAYRNAVDLDPLHQLAAASLAGTRKDITDSNFRRHMSRGYAALDDNELDSARTAFRQAGDVYPGNPAVAQALAQVENRESQSVVSRQLSRAADLEAREEWHQALSVYESLLDQDATLTEVKVKLIPARVRSDLDKRITRVLDDPLAMSDPSEYRRAGQTLSDARGISNPGEKLLGQIARLEKLVQAAVSSVNVVFQSDNLTEVTLYRVAALGRFEQTSLRLKPGRYVAAGTRQGFRDVRVEFTITGEPLDGPVVVRCMEPI